MRRINLGALRGYVFPQLAILKKKAAVLGVAGLVFVVSQAAVAAEAMTLTLSNGLRVVIVPANTSGVALVLRVGAGFLDEVPNPGDASRDESGVSHELEHALFRGTARHPSKDEFMAALNAIGASFNASTNFERTNYFIVAHGRALAQAAALQSDQLATPLLNDENFHSEAHPVSEEILRNLTNPHFTLYQFALALHADNRRMRRLMASTSEETLHHDPAVIRGFYERYYSADNMTLAVVGDVGDDPEKLRELLEKTYGRIRRFPTGPNAAFGPVARRAGADGQMPLFFDGKLPLFRVRFPAAGTRLLNVSFTLDAFEGALQASTYLGDYLQRTGQGSALQALYASGLLQGVHAGAETYREKVVFRLVLDLSAQGERRVQEVLKHLSAVLGTVARDGIPEEAFADLKESYQRNVVSRTGLLQMAEDLSDAAAKNGLDNITKDMQLYADLPAEKLKELSAHLAPGGMELTLLTPNVAETAPQVHGIPVATDDLSAALPELSLAFAQGGARLDEAANPFMRLSEPRVLRMRGVQVVLASSADESSAEAVLHFQMPRLAASSAQRMAATLAMMAFELDPANDRLMQQARDAGIALDVGLDSVESLLTITVDGDSHGATLALSMLLDRLKSYSVSDAAFARARQLYASRIRSLPAGEVTRQAMSLGVQAVTSPAAPGTPAAERAYVDADRMVGGVLSILQSTNLAMAQEAVQVGQRRWGVTGAFRGNWDPNAVNAALLRIVPESPRRPEARRHSAELPAGTRPRLIVRQTPHERQGVARLYPVSVQRYSPEYWVFKVLARILDERLDQTVRTARGMVYAVSSGFEALDEGGSVLYLAADSSHGASRLAMAYTTVMEHLLSTGVSAEELRHAASSVAGEAMGLTQGASGLYAAVFEGHDPRRAVALLQGLNPQRFMQIVNRRLPRLESLPEGARREFTDAAIVGPSDPAACARLLSPVKR